MGGEVRVGSVFRRPRAVSVLPPLRRRGCVSVSPARLSCFGVGVSDVQGAAISGVAFIYVCSKWGKKFLD